MQSAILKSQYGQRPLDGSFVSITNDNLCTENAIQCFSDCLLHSNGSDNIPSRFSTAIEILPSHVFTEHVFDAPFIVHVAPDLDKSIFSKLLTRAMQHHPKSLGTLLNIHFIEDDKTFYIIDFVINIFGISFLVHWMKENCITMDHDLKDFLKMFKHAGANSPQIQNMISLHSDRADEVLADKKIRDQLRQWEEQGYGNLPVCMAKTQYSFSTDPNLRGAPTGHSVPVREVRLSAGAGFIVAICGEIMTMPGLPRIPSAEAIMLNDDGQIDGLF